MRLLPTLATAVLVAGCIPVPRLVRTHPTRSPRIAAVEQADDDRRKGLEACGAGRFAEGLALIDRSLRDWKSAEAYTARSICRSSLGDFALAESDLTHAIRLVGRPSPAHLALRAIARFDGGNVAAGLEGIEGAIHFEPLNQDLRATKVRMLAVAGDLDGALDACATALELERHSAKAHSWRGILLLLAGRTGDATASLRRGIQLDPDGVWTALSLLFVGDGDRFLRDATPDAPWDGRLVKVAIGELPLQDAIAEANRSSSPYARLDRAADARVFAAVRDESRGDVATAVARYRSVVESGPKMAMSRRWAVERLRVLTLEPKGPTP